MRLFFVFLVDGLVDLGWESLTFLMPQILKKRCNFTLRLLLDLGNTSLEQNLRLETLDCLLFIPAIFYLLFGCSMVNFWLLLRKQSHSLMLIIASGLSSFGPKVTWRGWVSTPNWVSSGIWSKWQPTYPLTPNCRKYSPQTCAQFLQNVEMPPISKTAIAWHCSGL